MDKPDTIRLITRREFASRLRVSVKTVYRMGRAGLITPIILSSRTIRYDEKDLLKLIEKAS